MRKGHPWTQLPLRRSFYAKPGTSCVVVYSMIQIANPFASRSN